MAVSKKKSKTELAIEQCYQIILSGKILCVDPSTGSKSSRPGFAWYESGELKESGTIDMR